MCSTLAVYVLSATHRKEGWLALSPLEEDIDAVCRW